MRRLTNGRVDPMTMTDLEPPYSQVSQTRVVPKITSEQMMKGQREIIIQHGPKEYRLSITATGKLILTK